MRINWLQATTTPALSSTLASNYTMSRKGYRRQKHRWVKATRATAPTTRHQIRSSNFHLHRHVGTFGQDQRRYH